MYDRQDELDKLTDEPISEEMLDRVEALVTAECLDENGRYFSGFISIFSYAIVLLGKHGRLKVTNDNGGRVVEAVKEMSRV
jgi:hypothetical protein